MEDPAAAGDRLQGVHNVILVEELASSRAVADNAGDVEVGRILRRSDGAGPVRWPRPVVPAPKGRPELEGEGSASL